MSWKNTLGQFVGIFIGVSLGAGLVTMVMGERRRTEEVPVQQVHQEQSRQGVFDQVVGNVSSEKKL